MTMNTLKYCYTPDHLFYSFAPELRTKSWYSMTPTTQSIDYPFDFELEAAIEAILYIVSKIEDASFHKISKILYFADRKHLERFGRLICGDQYVAMRNGPVPSNLYQLLKMARNGNSSYGFGVRETAINHPVVIALREPSLGELSQSDLACLDESIQEHSHKNFNLLTQDSHDESWNAADENDIISIENLVLGMKSRDALLNYIKNPNP